MASGKTKTKINHILPRKLKKWNLKIPPHLWKKEKHVYIHVSFRGVVFKTPKVFIFKLHSNRSRRSLKTSFPCANNLMKHQRFLVGWFFTNPPLFLENSCNPLKMGRNLPPNFRGEHHLNICWNHHPDFSDNPKIILPCLHTNLCIVKVVAHLAPLYIANNDSLPWIVK